MAVGRVACHLIKAETTGLIRHSPTKTILGLCLFLSSQPAPSGKLAKYITQVGPNQPVIFLQSSNRLFVTQPTSNLKPLYQEENPWRKKYNAKAKSYQNFQKCQIELNYF